jgi:hypothetical protein
LIWHCGSKQSLEELLIQLLNREGLLDPASDPMADHQPGKLSPIDQHDSLAEKVRRLPRGRREGGGRHEQALRGLEPVEVADQRQRASGSN